MADRTGQTSEQPSPRTRAQILARQILTKAAEQLDEASPLIHPVTGSAVPRCMTDGWRDAALTSAMSVLDHVPSKFHRATARSLTRRVLPPVTGSTADYATALRAAAVAA